MFRILAYVIALAVVVAGAVWLADRPGAVTVDWLGWRIETSVPVLLLALLLIVAIFAALLRLLSGLARLPTRWSTGRREKRRRKGYAALSDGLAAAASGQVDAARKLAQRADRLLADPTLTRFLSAQAAQMSGDAEAAGEHFKAMLERPETAALGLRGLLEQALARRDDAAAIDLATRARAINPADPWLAETLFDLLVRSGRLREAQDLLAEAARRRAMPAVDAHRRRALVLNERAALALADGDNRQAIALSKQALALVPGLAPAAVRLARLHATAGRRRRAAAVLEKAWSHEPTPSVAQAYGELVPEEDPLQRVRRLEKLAADRPGDADSAMLLGEAALDAKLWGQARKHLLAAVETRPTAKAFRLLARLEQGEYNNQAAAQAWLDKVATAAAEPAWLCRKCGAPAPDWSLACPHCGAVDALGRATPRPATAITGPAAK